MDLGTLLLILLVLACPISMMWMMRGRHRMHDGMTGAMHGDGARDPTTPAASPVERPAELEAQQEAVERESEALREERRSGRIRQG